jgi:hypothetical protein
VVTINGKVTGIYTVKEAVDKQFLARAFGRANRMGNLYEGQVKDFVTSPTTIELKNEVEEMRKRDDLIALANLIKQTPDASFETTVSTKLRFDWILTAFAIDVIVSHWDSYWYYINNYYVYDNPADGKFVYIPHGMDRLFGAPVDFFGKPDPMQDPFSPIDILVKLDPSPQPPGRLGVRILAIPALAAKQRAEVGRVIRQVWDVAKLTARIDQAAKVITSGSSKAAADVMLFNQNMPAVRDYLAKRKTYVESLTK